MRLATPAPPVGEANVNVPLIVVPVTVPARDRLVIGDRDFPADAVVGFLHDGSDYGRPARRRPDAGGTPALLA